MTASAALGPAGPGSKFVHIVPSVKAKILTWTLPYTRKFRGKTIVIKYGSNTMTEEKLKHSPAHNMILFKLVDMNPAMVHGGGPQIDEALKKVGE